MPIDQKCTVPSPVTPSFTYLIPSISPDAPPYLLIKLIAICQMRSGSYPFKCGLARITLINHFLSIRCYTSTCSPYAIPSINWVPALPQYPHHTTLLQHPLSILNSTMPLLLQTHSCFIHHHLTLLSLLLYLINLSTPHLIKPHIHSVICTHMLPPSTWCCSLFQADIGQVKAGSLLSNKFHKIKLPVIIEYLLERWHTSGKHLFSMFFSTSV